MKKMTEDNCRIGDPKVIPNTKGTPRDQGLIIRDDYYLCMYSLPTLECLKVLAIFTEMVNLDCLVAVLTIYLHKKIWRPVFFRNCIDLL